MEKLEPKGYDERVDCIAVSHDAEIGEWMSTWSYKDDPDSQDALQAVVGRYWRLPGLRFGHPVWKKD